MKHIFLPMAAIAALAVVSCVKDERDPNALIPEEVHYDYTKLVLNEVSSIGEDAEKFIELYNTGNEEISLENVVINKDKGPSWTGVKGQKIAPKGFFAIVGAKNTTADGFSSGLSGKKNLIIELLDPDGNVLDKLQRGEEGSGWGNTTLETVSGSWSRIPDGIGTFQITDATTPGAANSTQGVADPTLVDNGDVPVPAGPAVVLNELYGAAATDAEKFIELYNVTGKDVSLKGYTLRKDEAECWAAGDDLVIKANSAFAIVGAKNSTPDGFKSGFSAKKSVLVELVDPEGNVVDVFQRGEKGTGWGDQGLDAVTGSWSRIPDGTGKFMVTETVTVNAKNATEGKEDATVVQ